MNNYLILVYVIISGIFLSCLNPQTNKERIENTEAPDSCNLDKREFRLIESAATNDSLFIEDLVKEPRNYFIFNKPFTEYLTPTVREKFLNSLILNYSHDSRPCSPIYYCTESFSYFKTSKVNIEVQKIAASRLE